MDTYEKKYKKAIERAKAMIKVANNREETYNSVITIFPELKESDDEKIRKAIHIYLDWLNGRNKEYQPKGEYTIRDMIAWLEKQGEQILSNSSNIGKDVQKPADKVEPKCEHKKATCKDYKEIIEHYGVRKQLKKLSEEVFELQEAVIEEDIMCGVNGIHTEHICEEIADVFILLFQLQEFYGISKYEISDMLCYKVERTLERIKKEVKNENEQ